MESNSISPYELKTITIRGRLKDTQIDTNGHSKWTATFKGSKLYLNSQSLEFVIPSYSEDLLKIINETININEYQNLEIKNL